MCTEYMKFCHHDIADSTFDMGQMPLMLSEKTKEELRGREANGTANCARSLAEKTFLFEGGLALFVSSAFGNGLNYLFMIFLAHQLGMDDFGVYALGVTLFNTVILLATAGLDTSAVKFGSQQEAGGDGRGVRRMISLIVFVAVVIGLVAGAGLLLAGNRLAYTF
jgi:hypothetical protein